MENQNNPQRRFRRDLALILGGMIAGIIIGMRSPGSPVMFLLLIAMSILLCELLLVDTYLWPSKAKHKSLPVSKTRK